MLHLKIKLHLDSLSEYYANHSTFHQDDAGLDLFCPENIVVNPGQQVAIKLGIACEPSSSYFLVPRSSISKTPLRMSNSIGIIDKGYRGELIAMVDNIKDLPYEIKKGTRLFQIISPALLPIQFSLVTELDSTSRGSGGFGSTDTNNNNMNNEIDQVNPNISPFSIGNRREQSTYEFNN